MRSLLLSLFILSFSVQGSWALTCTFDITPPATRTDGTPVTPADVAVYWLYSAECQTCFPIDPDYVFPSDTLGDPQHPILIRDRCKNNRWWRITAIDQDGREGLPSQSVFLKKGR